MNWNNLTQKQLKKAGPEGVILIIQNEKIYESTLEYEKGEFGKKERKFIKETINNIITEEDRRNILKAINKRTKAERTIALNKETRYINLLTEMILLRNHYKKKEIAELEEKYCSR